MAAGATYEPIATQTLGSSASTVTFSSISGSYTDLVLIVNSTRSNVTNNYVRVGNGSIDTGSNYSQTFLYGTGSSSGSGRQTNATGLYYNLVGDTPGTRDVTIFNFQNYSNATTYKTYLCRENNASDETATSVGLWRSTSAINTIQLYPGAGTFSTGSTFTLYGIKAA